MAAEKSKREEEINRLFYLQSAYNQQYEAVLSEITTMSMARTALERNLYLLENNAKLKNSSVLLNAEGGTYFEANVKDVSKVITYVGAGYLVEKNMEQAKTFMKNSIDMSGRTIRRLLEDKEKLEKELVRIQYAIEGMQQGR